MDDTFRPTILLIEDNEDHAEITRFHITDHAPDIDVVWLGDGDAAMQHIRKRHRNSGGDYPWLILLDVKLPKYSGHEVLREIKSDEHLCKIPVVMFTTSNAIGDIDMALREGANSYIQKPLEYGEFSSVIARIIDYWRLNQHHELVSMMNRGG